NAVFSWRGTALRRAKWRVLSMTVYAIITQVAYEIGVSLPGVEFKNFFRLAPGQHAVLGSLLGFLIVFRMDASNNRFWEGRAGWGGGGRGGGRSSTPAATWSRVGVTYTDRGTELADLVSGYAECLRHSLQGNEDMAEIEVYYPRS